MAGPSGAVNGDGGAGEGEVDGCAILLCDVIGMVEVFVESGAVGGLNTPAGRVNNLACVVVEGKVHRKAARRELEVMGGGRTLLRDRV